MGLDHDLMGHGLERLIMLPTKQQYNVALGSGFPSSFWNLTFISIGVSAD